MIRIAMLALALGAAPAVAGGFYLQEQSPTAVGRAFAGEAAIADTAATLFFNPAGMTRLPGASLDLGVHTLVIDSAQEDRGSRRGFPGGANLPTGGGDGGNPFDQPVLVPSGYASFQINASPVWVGLGVSAPFGLKVVYDEGWFGRYDSIGSDLKAFNIQPSLAIRLNDRIAIGGGIDVQTLEATLSSALPNLVPGLPDGRLEITGRDMAFGWNLGVLADLGFVRLGGHYRSHVDHLLSGVARFSGLLGPLAAQNGPQRGFAPISTPDIARVSAVVPLGRSRLLGSVVWTNWSRFADLTVEDEAGRAFIASPQRYRDSWSYSLGGEVDVSDRLTLRAGTMFDQTPTVDGFRTTRVPDGDRWWASAGATLKIAPAVAVNVSYAHVFVKAEAIDRTDPVYLGSPAELQVLTRSRNTGNVDQVAASLSLRF